MIATLPLLAGAGALIAKVTSYAVAKSNKAYARANELADASFSKIRTVAANGAEESSIKAYIEQLDRPAKVEERAGTLAGSFTGIANMVFFLSFALAMWFGSLRIRENSEFNEDGILETTSDSWSAGKVMTVIFSTLIGSFSLG